MNLKNKINMNPEIKNDEPLRFLVFSVAMRKDSLNTKLAKLSAGVIKDHGGKVDFADMKEFDVPSFNQDLEVNTSRPKGAEEFRKRLLVNDAFIIVSPEYNSSMPGLIKNAIDWVSRYRPQPFNERHGLLMSASPSMAGVTGDCGRFVFHWNIWAREFFRICFPLLWHMRHLIPTDKLQTLFWQNALSTILLRL